MSIAASPGPEPKAGPSRAVSLIVLAGSVQARVDTVLKARGLNLRKYGALHHVVATPGISFSELARRFEITVQSMHTLIAALIAAGLLESTIPHPGDSAELVVTEAGRVLLRELDGEISAIDDGLFGAPAPLEWQQLGDAVTAVAIAATRAAGS